MHAKLVALAHHMQGSVDSGCQNVHCCSSFHKLGERLETNVESPSPHPRGLRVREVGSIPEARGRFAQGRESRQIPSPGLLALDLYMFVFNWVQLGGDSPTDKTRAKPHISGEKVAAFFLLPYSFS